MKRRLLFLAIILTLNNKILAATVTIQQADAIIQTGSASSSATNFFNIISGSLSGNMTQTNFNGYYTPNFVSSYTQAEYQDLLNSYLSDITSANYTQAQIDLIKLAAATFKNGTKPLVSASLQAVANPWPSGGKLFIITSGVPLNQVYLQFFVDQFALIYAKLSASNNNSGNNSGNSGSSGTQVDVVIPINPSQKVADPTGAMLLEEGNDNGVMDSIAATANQALNSAMLSLEQQMNTLQTQALADPNIENATTNQGYINQLQTLVQQAESGTAATSLQTIASSYQQQIANAAQMGIKNLGTLASEGSNTGSLLSAYTQNLNLKSTSDQAQVATDLGQIKGSIDSLQNSIQGSITKMIKNSTPSGLPDWVNDIIKGATDAGAAAITSVALYYASKLICSYVTIGTICPPDVPDIIKKLGLPQDIQGVMEKLGLGKVSDLINNSVSFVDGLYGKLADVLGLDAATVKSIIGSGAGNALGEVIDPGTALPNFMQQVANIQDQVISQVTNAEPADILKAIGQVLQARPSSLSDVTDLVAQVKTTLAGSPTPGTGTGTDIAGDIPGATAFNNLQANLTTQQALIENIKSLGLTRSAFQSQIDILQTALESNASLTAEEKALIQEKIDAGKSILKNSENPSDNPADDPFVAE